MGRYSEIQGAFRDSIKQESNGRRTVTTENKLKNVYIVECLYAIYGAKITKYH